MTRPFLEEGKDNCYICINPSDRIMKTFSRQLCAKMVTPAPLMLLSNATPLLLPSLGEGMESASPSLEPALALWIALTNYMQRKWHMRLPRPGLQRPCSSQLHPLVMLWWDCHVRKQGSSPGGKEVTKRTDGLRQQPAPILGYVNEAILDLLAQLTLQQPLWMSLRWKKQGKRHATHRIQRNNTSLLP